MARQHQEWLEDLVIRLLCVFALDRFGDFVSDEVRHNLSIVQTYCEMCDNFFFR